MNCAKGDSTELNKSITDLQNIQPNNTISNVSPKQNEVIDIMLQYVFGKIKRIIIF